MQVTQEVLQRGVVGIRQLVDALVQPDVPQAVIFNFCIAIGHAACQFFRAQGSMGKRPHALAASIKPWCRVFVSSGSGSSRSHIFRTLVTLFISPAHSGASKSTASMSIFESTNIINRQGNGNRQAVCVSGASKTSKWERTFFEPCAQVRNLACRAADPIDALVHNPVLLDGFTAFSHDWRYLNIVSKHLLCEVDAKRWPPFVL